jgi:hypothetical protein
MPAAPHFWRRPSTTPPPHKPVAATTLPGRVQPPALEVGEARRGQDWRRRQRRLHAQGFDFNKVNLLPIWAKGMGDADASLTPASSRSGRTVTPLPPTTAAPWIQWQWHQLHPGAQSLLYLLQRLRLPLLRLHGCQEVHVHHRVRECPLLRSAPLWWSDSSFYLLQIVLL